MANTSSSKDKSAPHWALVVSLGPFGGFEWKKGRLCLGWVVFSTVPSDFEDQLKRATEEMRSLQAEIDRLSLENQRLQALVERVSSGVR